MIIDNCDKEIRIKYRSLTETDGLSARYVAKQPKLGIEKSFSTPEEADAEALRMAKNSSSSYPVFVSMVTEKRFMVYERWGSD